MIVVSIAGATTVLAISTKSNNINGFHDLKDAFVCTTIGSTSEDYLQENNLGYSIFSVYSIEIMFEYFWTKKCNAIIYDYPTLQYEIFKSGKEAILVGEIFHKEQYGMYINDLNPYKEKFISETYALNLNHGKIQLIKDRWFKNIINARTTNVDVPIIIWFLPLIGFIVVMLYMVNMHKNYDKYSENYTKEKNRRNSLWNDTSSIAQEKDNCEIYYGNDYTTFSMNKKIDQLRFTLKKSIEMNATFMKFIDKFKDFDNFVFQIESAKDKKDDDDYKSNV